jgi:hypothetical protein
MSHLEFKQQLHAYSQWRHQLLQAIEMYLEWRKRYDLNDSPGTATIVNMLQGLRADRITLAFVAEFSRGKTELINALFFAETGVRLLPSSPGRTTMSPTEVFYDPSGSYIRLLNIESRLEDISLNEFKQMPERWLQIDLDYSLPSQMQKTFQELIATKHVERELAVKLGLWNEREAAEQGIVAPDTVEIPRWRHALISFPHPLLMEGLAILDTPGLNALGTEPELTLSMLPSAQAIIFVLSADTGVTKSDMEMWRNHVCNARGNNKQGLAVVMNKIDSMWDDLSGASGFEAAIQSQIASSAKSLEIHEDAIFPVSAKQALLAKVKANAPLLEKSRLAKLEAYLSEHILKQRRKLLMAIIEREMGHLIKSSLNITQSQLHNARKQLDEFKKIDFDNSEMTGKLLAETRDGQSVYLANIENFKASRTIFAVQAKMLIDSFASHKIDTLIKTSRTEMANNLTTYGIKQNIRKLFNDLRDVLQDAIEITNETRRLINAIHTKFQDDHGFKAIEPELFSIKPYQFELEQIFEEGEAFRSSSKTTLTEQSMVINKLYSTLIFKARNVLKQAHQDAINWSNTVLTPLMHQIKDHKIQVENRLLMLRKIDESKENILENIQKLEKHSESLKIQRKELMFMIKSIQGSLDTLKIEG